MKKLLFICALTFSVVFNTKAAVEIQYAGNKLSFESNPRLASVLERLVVSTDFYWHSASLFDLDSPKVATLKREIIKDLDVILNKTGVKTEKYKAIKALKKQVLSWQVAVKLPLVIDYDMIRIKEELNYRFDDGRYLLHLPFREYEIKVIGAIEEAKKINHRAAAPVQSYFDNSDFSLREYADSEFVFVIHPNGSYKKVSLGLHSQQYVEIPPGGTIYIPIRELPFDATNAQLNEKIARLAGNLLP